MRRVAIIAAALAVLAWTPAAAQQGKVAPSPISASATAASSAPGATVLEVRPQHPRLLLTPEDLPRLRQMARARALRWRRLLAWALEPAREGAVPHDGPGLALASLVISQIDPELGGRLGRLAVACALKGARYGTVQSFTKGTLVSKTGNRDPLTLIDKGYKILRPSFRKGSFLPVARYTASEVMVQRDSDQNPGTAKSGATYLLLLDDPLAASLLVRQVALTLDWAWPAFNQSQRRGVARWLISQAQFFAKRGLGCFDTESAAMLSLYTLAALAAHGVEPAAQKLLVQAWQDRFEGHVRPCLQNLGAGGGWFEGDTSGARAGLDLALFALAMRNGAGAGDLAQVTWFKDRLAYLMFRLLPGVARAPTGVYRQVAPGGDAVFGKVRAAELTRMQIMALLSLRPDDSAAGAVRALLLDGRTPTLLASHRLFYDFLWLDPTAPTAPLATAPLSHLAPATGRAVLRSDWSERATWLGFNCGPHFALHQHLNAASFTIFRLGLLLPQGGGYDGPATSHAMNYGIRSVAQNTLLVFDPQEYSWYDMRAGRRPKGTYSNDGGQRAWAQFNRKGKPIRSAPWTASGFKRGHAPWDKLGAIYQVAHIEALEDKPRYAYLRGRATTAYDGSTHKLKRFVRHLFLLRANGPDDAEAVEAVVVADDVELARRGLSVHFVLHFQEQPKPAGELKKLGIGRWRGAATSLIAEAGESRLVVVPVWPPDARLDIMGGAGQAGSWVNTRNYPPRPPTVNPAPWRAEYVKADAAVMNQPMLHVLLPGDRTDVDRPPIAALKTGDSRTIGVVIKDPSWPRVLVLRLGEPGAEPPITYQYPPGHSRHLIAGLAPEASYTVEVDPLKVTIKPGPGLKSSPAGLLAFRVGPALSQPITKRPAARKPPRVAPAMR